MPTESPPFTFQRRVGKLVELRFLSPIRSREDVFRFGQPLRDLCARNDMRIVICADYRRAKVFAADCAEEWTALMKLTHPILERSGILLDPANAMLNLQLGRIVGAAASPIRRTFTTAPEVQAWLSSALSSEERTRLSTFLSDPTG